MYFDPLWVLLIHRNVQVLPQLSSILCHPPESLRRELNIIVNHTAHLCIQRPSSDSVVSASPRIVYNKYFPKSSCIRSGRSMRKILVVTGLVTLKVSQIIEASSKVWFSLGDCTAIKEGLGSELIVSSG